jgi:hypothetical protein
MNIDLKSFGIPHYMKDFLYLDIVEEVDEENKEPADTNLPSRTSLHQLRQVCRVLFIEMHIELYCLVNLTYI